MRCKCCNKNLSDFESTRKDDLGEYFDMCNHCFNASAISEEVIVVDREDLSHIDDTIVEGDVDE